ncbi:hypothetical protein XENOCAPTIV_022232 [Xenoophorus captivus]|uniref:Uncharacterized protein n=1 Tax=Xenoophorus captivus TaxID=1517983 RepID=A0ABV0RA15_9TELE
MNLLTFLYQTDLSAFKLFQEGPCGAKVRLQLLSLQICASVASSRETRWKWPRNVISCGFIIPGDVRAACSTVRPKWMTPTLISSSFCVFVSCSATENKTLDVFYANIKDSYISQTRPPLDKLDHSLVFLCSKD